MKILVTGGTGFVGSELGKLLVKYGHEVFVTTRNTKRAMLQVAYPAKFIEVDLSQSILSKDLWPQVDVVINLMGENVGAGRWTKDRREKIIRSRETALKNLTENMPKSVKQFISASAIGCYGSQGDEILIESSPVPDSADFLVQVCKKWEQQILVLEKSNPNINFITLRIGMVLGSFGGALTKMLPIFRKNLGAELGSGKQWMSWIHLVDLVAMIAFLCGKESVKGVINAVAPEPVTNAEFTRELTKQLKVFQAPRVPMFVLKGMLGEMSQMILSSQRVSAQKIILAGFKFKYPAIALALKECLLPHLLGDEILYAEQFLDFPIEKVFEFFAESKNLKAITPPTLNFEVLNQSTDKIQEGTEINYKLKVHGIPFHWKTLIRNWSSPHKFIDQQMAGPYKQWIHLHQFEKTRIWNLDDRSSSLQVAFRAPRICHCGSIRSR